MKNILLSHYATNIYPIANMGNKRYRAYLRPFQYYYSYRIKIQSNRYLIFTNY